MGIGQGAKMMSDVISIAEAERRRQAELVAQTDSMRAEQQAKNKKIMEKETGSNEVSGRQGTVSGTAIESEEKKNRKITLLGSDQSARPVKTLLGE